MAGKENIIRDKSFALGIIKLYKQLQAANEYVLSRQLLRSATSWRSYQDTDVNCKNRSRNMTKIQHLTFKI